jgi:serine/threonine protein kinase
VKSIFGHALEIESAEGRAAYLDEAFGADAGLRDEVEGLLATLGRAGEFMRRPAAAVAMGMTSGYPPVTEGPGTRVGPYKLLQQIGEGGMGVVYLAEQDEPIRRKVALKIIKPGMDSALVIARFEAERQALAMMDHTNIARVLDAGTTESGRPYFVMELVHGVPITTYCDENKLTPRERLELFVPICQAIQHAHQKGIIHRDIKPSNILVTMYDDKPVPKVIDFGVAKAVEQRLTEKTLFTQYGALVGTFEYMSPEQAEMNAFGVDTRSDIYALGVLLYELLTGTTPLEKGRLREAAFGEIVRLIKEEEPPRPSVRLSTSGTLAKVAAARKTEPAKLSRLMRGELDWVVMKCLEKDRSRRYDTASALARDVERHLKDEPVEARPPSAWYRFRKTIRRNRTALTVAGAVAAVVLVGTAAVVWQVVEKDRYDRDLAKAIEDERRQYALDRAIEAAFSGDLERAHKAIVAAEKAGVAPDRAHWLHGLVHYQQGKIEDAIKEFQSSIVLKPSVAAAIMHGLALFDASLLSGDYGRYGRGVKRDLINSLKPETAEDYLFRGLTMERFKETRVYKEGLFKNGQALDDIDKAIEMRETPIARAIRAVTVYGNAAEEGDLPLLERALVDIQRIKLRLWGNKFVRFKSLFAHLHAADLYEKRGQSDKEKAALVEAGRDAAELEGGPAMSYVMGRVFYFERIGDRKAALRELDQATLRPETSDLVTQYALTLYEVGQDAEALRVLKERLKPGNVSGQVLQIILCAEQGEISPDKAYDRYRKLTASLKREGKSGGFDFLTLLLLGKKKEAAESIPDQSPLKKYLTESKDVEEFLQSSGKSRIISILNHHIVGLVRLSDGDRMGAKEQFQKLLDTKFYALIFYPYARAYLARLTRDEKWPKWIPIKK